MATTKAAEKAQAKANYNAFLAVCPSRQLLDRISDKWVVLILCALGGETADTSEQSGTPQPPRRCASPSSPGNWPASARRC